MHQSSAHPAYRSLEVGPPALWVSRFGIPAGGVLLDSGLDDRAEYAHFDALALSPREVICHESLGFLHDPEDPSLHISHTICLDRESQLTGAHQRDLYRELETWANRPWRDQDHNSIGAEAWGELSKELELPLPMTMCALSYELGAERGGVASAQMAHPSPRLWAARYPAVYLWCRRRHRGFIVGESDTAVEALSRMLMAPLQEQRSSGEHPMARASHNPWLTQGRALTQSRLRPHMGWPTYRAAIQSVHEHLLSGDIYQLNLTLGMTSKLADEVTIEEVFTRLREANSGQFGALFRFDETRAAISLSPERLVTWGAPHPSGTGQLIETAPIKGTRPKYADPDQDLAERDALLKSEKDQAEHLMILDLERNDLGRICETGTVEVVTQRELRSYTTVHHLVSVVRGRLRPETKLTDILEAVFPGGSVTGAPKLSAMHKIHHLEVGPRGIYCGALGYLDPLGGGDLNIPIRTAMIHGEHLTYHAGGGVVADSTARDEWDELWVKTRGVQRGLGIPPERSEEVK